MKLEVDPQDVMDVIGEARAPDELIYDLKKAMIECNSRLNMLSMGTEGELRARICIANNFLNRALGRTEHYVAPNLRYYGANSPNMVICPIKD